MSKILGRTQDQVDFRCYNVLKSAIIRVCSNRAENDNHIVTKVFSAHIQFILHSIGSIPQSLINKERLDRD